MVGYAAVYFYPYQLDYVVSFESSSAHVREPDRQLCRPMPQGPASILEAARVLVTTVDAMHVSYAIMKIQ